MENRLLYILVKSPAGTWDHDIIRYNSKPVVSLMSLNSGWSVARVPCLAFEVTREPHNCVFEKEQYEHTLGSWLLHQSTSRKDTVLGSDLS